MTKWILALCVALGSVSGCLIDNEDDASLEESAGDTTGDLEKVESNITYIDYGALRGNRAPCPPNQVKDTRTNRCVPRPANIYRRGCTQLTRCARG